MKDKNFYQAHILITNFVQWSQISRMQKEKLHEFHLFKG